jgi:two-component system sensor histidine kinase EvgS
VAAPFHVVRYPLTVVALVAFALFCSVAAAAPPAALQLTPDELAVVDVVPIAPLKLGLAVNTQDPILARVLGKAEAAVSHEELEALRLRWGIAPDPIHATGATRLTLDERVRLARLPTLRVGVEVDRAPYSFLNEKGEFDGLSADYMDYLRDALGFDTTVVPARDWKELQALAQAGKVDMVAAALPGDVLNPNMLFTTPYEQFPEVIVARLGGPPIAGAEDLAGRRVAIRDEPTLVSMLQAAAPTAHLVPVASNEAGLAKLADGRVDAYVGTLAAIDNIVRDRYAGVLHVVGPTGLNREFAIGIDRRYADILPVLNSTLEQMSSHDRMQIRAKWLAEGHPAGFPVRWVLGVALLGGLVTAVLGFAYARARREVLARRQAEARLANVTRTLPVAVFEVRVDPQGERHFTYAAGDTQGTIGVAADALIADAGVVAARICAEDLAMIEQHVARTLAALIPVPMLEFRVVTDHGQRWIRTAGGQPSATADGVEWSGYWVDVTDTHEQAAALRVAIETSEREVQARSAFLAMMSHEIRTPMSGIVSWLELAAEAGLPREQAEILDTVMESSEALQQILDDILDFSQIDSGRLALHATEIDLRSVVDSAVAIFGARAAAKGVYLYNIPGWQLAPLHVGDALRIRQVLSNLLSNAVKFTDAGHVELAVSVVEEHAGTQTLRFTVSDTGVGMSPDQLGRLFQPFSQVGAGAPAQLGGSGLGLAISKNLATLMGGDLYLDSRPGEGTRAIFDLALQVPANTGSALPAPFHGKRAGLRTADARVAMELTHALRHLGFEVMVNHAGPRATATSGLDLLVADAGAAEATGIAHIELVHGASPGGQWNGSDRITLQVAPLRWRTVHAACARALGMPGQVAGSNAAGSAHPPPSHGAARLLLVEDHAVNRRIIACQVEHLGHTCAVAANGQEALALLSRSRFDLVLTDCHMPGMDGYALTRAIRHSALPEIRDIPVVALSAGVLEEQIQRCLAAGMNDFLPKPVLLGPLGEIIARNLVGAPAPVIVPCHGSEASIIGHLGSSEEADSLFAELLETTRSDLAQYDLAIQQGRKDTARELLHRMKGALLLLTPRVPGEPSTRRFGRSDVVDAIAQLMRRSPDAPGPPP